ncbi:MAG: GntR family transcriptional regulator [Paracoccaceae bacterium]|nr:MAG: GntR family transcriptional regulator [Paracoccaceae bacterium]
MADDIYDKIRALIAAGVYIGGDVLPEGELGARLGVSRTPIREALRRLQAEGVIRREAYRRAVLVDLDPAEVIHIFTARSALEPVAVGMAMARAEKPFVDNLRALHADMESALHDAGPDRRLYRELNARFHRVIWAQGGNALFAELVNLVARKPVVSPTFSNWTLHELARSNAQHGDLVDAFAARDTDWAEATMRAHLLSARAVYRRISALQPAPAGQDDWTFPDPEEARADAGGLSAGC